MSINRWASFLAHEKLEPKRCDEYNDIFVLIKLTEELAKLGGIPCYRPYRDRLESRRFVVNTAMDLGIDLMAITHRGKPSIGRGLLDIWEIEYKRRFGSAHGTAAWAELKRRGVVTKLAKENNERN